MVLVGVVVVGVADVAVGGDCDVLVSILALH